MKAPFPPRGRHFARHERAAPHLYSTRFFVFHSDREGELSKDTMAELPPTEGMKPSGTGRAQGSSTEETPMQALIQLFDGVLDFFQTFIDELLA